MNVCVTVNSLYVRYLYVMLQSLYENNKKGSITLYVLQKDFTGEDKEQITALSEKYGNTVEYIWINPEKVKDLPDTFKNKNNLSIEILFRLLIPECLPDNIDRVLMLDVDIVINKDITPLYETDFENCVLAAVPNIGANGEVMPEFRGWYPADRKHWVHYNTGVLLWNLKKIREDYLREHVFTRAVQYTNITKPQFEEEFFNAEFGEDLIKAVAPEWNYQSRVLRQNRANPKYPLYTTVEAMKENCGIIHYVDINPWQEGVKDVGYYIWWEYCKKTPYYMELLEKNYERTELLLAQKEKTLSLMDKMNRQTTQKRIVDGLMKLGYQRIAIYGANRIAKQLDEILFGTQIAVDSFIDQSYFTRIYFESKSRAPVIDVKEIAGREQKVDAIVVSSEYFYEEAKSAIEKYSQTEVILINKLTEEYSFRSVLFDAGVQNGDNIAVYGAGNCGQKVFQKLLGDKIFRLCSWVDKNYMEIGFPVQEPKTLKELKPDFVIIAIENIMVAETVRRELNELGINDDKILWFSNISSLCK